MATTQFGELWATPLRDLLASAARDALALSKVECPGAFYVGCAAPGSLVEQEHIAPLLADRSGLGSLPAVRIEAGCASGALAFRSAFLEVASGASDVVLAAGVEKTTDHADVQRALAMSADQEYEAFHGATLAALWAMMARVHMHRFGTTETDMAAVAVKNHEHGSQNPKAQFRNRITVEQVLGSGPIAEPLKLLDGAAASDGAAAIVLGSLEAAKRSGKPLVRVAGIGAASDRFALHDRADLTRLAAVATAAARAYQMAGCGPRDVQVAEVYDLFTISEIMAIESLGLVEMGEGAAAARSGRTKLGGAVPVNPSGGLKSRGHPMGATGIAQIAEIVSQLRGEAGTRQVHGARVGLAQCAAGTGSTATVCLLEGMA
jgi:acetyl-CoA C-acetyltransferase